MKSLSRFDVLRLPELRWPHDARTNRPPAFSRIKRDDEDQGLKRRRIGPKDLVARDGVVLEIANASFKPRDAASASRIGEARRGGMETAMVRRTILNATGIAAAAILPLTLVSCGDDDSSGGAGGSGGAPSNDAGIGGIGGGPPSDAGEDGASDAGLPDGSVASERYQACVGSPVARWRDD